jgi:hypothetical protein
MCLQKKKKTDNSKKNLFRTKMWRKFLCSYIKCGAYNVFYRLELQVVHKRYFSKHYNN